MIAMTLAPDRAAFKITYFVYFS